MSNINFFNLYILSFLGIISVFTISILFFKLFSSVSKYDKRLVAKSQTKREWLSVVFNSLVLSFSIVIFYKLWSFLKFNFDLNGFKVFNSFLVFLVFGEIQYYFIHRAFHLKILIKIHAKHHKSLVCNPETALSVSFLEVIFLYLFLPFPAAVIASFFVTLSFWGLIIWYLMQFFLIAWLHSNLLIPEGRIKKILKKIGIFLPEDHSNHHIHHKINYGLYFSFLDRFFKTNLIK